MQRETTFAQLLRHLLTKSTICPAKEILPKSIKEWRDFINLAYRNRLISLLYHFVSCNKCSSRIPKKVSRAILAQYAEIMLKYKRYKEIKSKLKEFRRNTHTPLFILKDMEEYGITSGYPPYYIPIKFDIDVWGGYEDLAKFIKYIAELGYNPKGYHYGWPDRPIPQYKFAPTKKLQFYPSIEYRYKAITIYPTKKNILDRDKIEKFSDELWNNIKMTKGNFTVLSPEYVFIHNIFIYFFEDTCRGLNCLYRIWLLYNHDKLNWEKIKKIAKSYHMINIVTFVCLLGKREFSTSKPDRSLCPVSTKLALRLIDLKYVCRAKFINDKDFSNWKRYYTHFLTRELLTEEFFWQKMIFFLHPKRLLFLVWGLIF